MIGKQAVVGFLLGAGVSAVVVSGLTQKPTVVQQEVAKDPVEKKVKKRQSLSVQKGCADLSEIQKTKEDVKKLYGDKRKEKLTELNNADLGLLMKSLEADADFLDGMDYSSESLFDDAIKAMAERDLAGMIQWVNGEYEQTVAEKILKDWFRGQELMTKREAFDALKGSVSEEVVSDLAQTAFVYSGSKGGLETDDALYFLNFMKLGNGSGGSDSKFASGFAFGEVANAALSHIESNATEEYGNRSLPGWPTNFFQEWVKADRDAAFTFYEQNHKEGEIPLPFCDYVDLVEGYVASAPKSESSAWVNEVLKNGELKDNEYKDLVKILAEQKLGGLGYTDEVLRLSGDPDYIKAEIVADSFRWAGDERFEKAMAEFDDFETYLEAAERAIANHSPFYKSDYGLVKRMKGLERPQHEIDRVKELFKEAENERWEIRRAERERKAREQKPG